MRGFRNTGLVGCFLGGAGLRILLDRFEEQWGDGTLDRANVKALIITKYVILFSITLRKHNFSRSV